MRLVCVFNESEVVEFVSAGSRFLHSYESRQVLLRGPVRIVFGRQLADVAHSVAVVEPGRGEGRRNRPAVLVDNLVDVWVTAVVDVRAVCDFVGEFGWQAIQIKALHYFIIQTVQSTSKG